MKKITSAILRFLLRDIAGIVRVLGHLEDGLAKHIAATDKEISAVDADIASLEAARAELVRTRSTAANLQVGVASLRG